VLTQELSLAGIHGQLLYEVRPVDAVLAPRGGLGIDHFERSP